MPRTLVRAYGPLGLLLLVFGAAYATTLDAHGMLGWDEAEYASLARSILRGEGFVINEQPNPLRPPVLPLGAAAAIAVGRSTRDVVLKVATLVFSLIALALVYGYVGTEYGALTGAVAAALLGLFPAFWALTTFLLSEMPYLAFFFAAVVCFYRGLYRAPRFFYWAWFWWALAALTRYTAVLFAPLVILFLGLAWLSRAPEVRRNVWSRHFLLSPLVAAAMLIPWLARQQLTFGDALIGFRMASKQLIVYARELSMPWHFYPLQLPGMVGLVPLVLIGVGIVWAVRTRDRFALHCLLVCAGILVWFSCYRYKETRLVTSILPFLAVVAAQGATKLLRASLPTRRSAAVLALVLGVAFTLSTLSVRGEAARTTLGYPSFVQAMRFLRERTAPGAVLAGASRPQIHWYADRRAVGLPDASRLPEVLDRAEWVVVVNFEPVQRPYVRGLLRKVTDDDLRAGNAVIFDDGRFYTALIRSSLLRARP